MGVMSEVAKHADGTVGTAKAKILVYSDDKNVREQVRFAVGSRTHGRVVDWTEAATHAGVLGLLDAGGFDLVVLDGEAAKSGGMGICRQMKHEYYDCPPVLLLVGRPGDAWLATWSEADAAVAHPLDPFVLRDAVDEFFVPSSV